MNLFCLPYAGGSESIYYSWRKFLDPSIKLYPIKLKGRGKRFNEDYYNSLEEAVDDIYACMKNLIINEDYAIYGHSMGSLLAYELYYKIMKNNLREPKHIFFSGYKAPSMIREKENIYELPDYEFMKRIIEIGGTPEELLENEELLNLFIPIIRNDFKIIENYIYKEKSEKIKCDVSILNGRQDDITLEEILAWKNHVDLKSKFYDFDGNHFFINSNVHNIVNIINNTLSSEKILKLG
ncbi:thioesterase II family protein [Clostridium sp. UBA6640]|uniref:thioesterase II family protein n=1 Tax=Clostridium sp. UBA6640 TaxID=1946370 RepID=UPI0025B98FF0|nr:thioesterase domain-containing protein [Clostridium sp. UBA6640]